MIEEVILVNENDQEIGTMEKMQAHISGDLHRAFSIFLFNDNDELLLQKRASSKYHSGGLWTNTCCSHPRPGESLKDAVNRRLQEEMGISCDMSPAFQFIYKASLDQGLIEHEFDHVYIGTYNGKPDINVDEVEDWKYVDLIWIENDILQNPGQYTEWFKIAIKTFKEKSIKSFQS
ncbi:MAG: isopentenyl-diphosphate Delta-isomerase [Flavobacteriales bacterium]